MCNGENDEQVKLREVTKQNFHTVKEIRFYLFHLNFIILDVTDPVGDVVSFITSFNEKYGNVHPTFYQGTYSQVSLSIYLTPIKSESIPIDKLI